jgi:ATP-dependent HslUV protease ATP-binding subunit HslU
MFDCGRCALRTPSPRTNTALSVCRAALSGLGTEGVQLQFTEDGIQRLAEIAYQVNERTENIGARRLDTMLERLLESISFEAADRSGHELTIDSAYVDQHLGELAKDEDLSRYIL